MFLLDTNIVSEPVRPRPSRTVLRRMDEHSGDLAIASVTWHELLFGAARLPEGKKRRYIESYLESVVKPTLEVLPYDAAAAAWHASERARLQASGETPPFADGQIAAVAVVNGLTLVTRNVDDFLRFEGLRVENWFD